MARVIGMGSRYCETNQLGVTNSEEVRQTGIAVVGFGSQMVPIFYSGKGSNSGTLRDPSETGRTVFPPSAHELPDGQPLERNRYRPALTRALDPNI